MHPPQAHDDDHPTLLVLSGGSLAGKSTIARALVDRLGAAWVHIEADRFAPTPGSQDDFDHARFSTALHRAAFAWLDQGYGVVLDGALPFPEDQVFSDCLRLCQEREAVFIGVTADDATLREHAAARPGSDLAWARQQAETVNANVPLDVVIDATTATTEASVDVILRVLGRTGSASGSALSGSFRAHDVAPE